MKTKLLIAAVMFLAISAAAYAQATFQVSSIPVNTVASCGAAELTGDVIFTAINGTGATAANNGTLVLTYNVPVVSIAAGSNIKVFVASGGGAPAESAADEAPTNITISGNVVTIPIHETINTAGDSIHISGVRVNVAGQNVSNVSVTTTASGTTGFAFVGGQTNLLVVSSVAPAFKAFGSALAGFSSLSTTGGITVPASTAANLAGAGTAITVNVKENFNTALGQPNQLVQFTFAGIPAGVALTLPVSVTTTSATAGGGGDGYQACTPSGSGATFGCTVTGTAPVLTSTSSSLQVFYKLQTPSAGGASGNTIDTFPLLVTATLQGTATLPLATNSVITVTPALGPLATTGMVYVPRYGADQCAIGPITILTVVTARTPLLIPYALFSSAPPLNTGIAISNTSSDPGATAMGITTAATAQTGAITFYFFPQTGITGPTSSFSTSTTPASTPGGGFTTATGLVPAGSTYVVNLSELLTSAGFTGTFWQGYIIAVCDFTNGHGQYFVGNANVAAGTGFEQGALMLVINANRTDPSIESLGN